MTNTIEKIEEELMDKISDLRFDGNARNQNLFLIKTELHSALTRVREETLAEVRDRAEEIVEKLESADRNCNMARREMKNHLISTLKQ